MHILEEVGAVLHYLRPVAHYLRELIPRHHLVQVRLLEVVVVSRPISTEALRDMRNLAHVIAHRYVRDVDWWSSWTFSAFLILLSTCDVAFEEICGVLLLVTEPIFLLIVIPFIFPRAYL